MTYRVSMPPAPGPVACSLMFRPGRIAALLLLLGLPGCTLLSRQPVSITPAQQALTNSDTLRVLQVQSGVRYLYAWQQQGPWAIHVLEVQPACEPEWQARKGGSSLADRARPSMLMFNALAGVNADFFALPAGTPVGVQVSGSEVIIGPAERRVAVGFADDRGWIDEVRLDARVSSRRFSSAITQVNRARAQNAEAEARLFTHWFGAGAPRDTMVVSARVRKLAPGRGVVELIDTLGNGIWLDTTHIVLHLPRGTPLALDDTLRWTAQVRAVSTLARAGEALGGFPWLLRAGQNVLSEQPGLRPEFSERRHPRTAVAIAAGGSTLLVVVDGRQPPYSDGMTLPELTALLQRMGATDALNLDGGGSSTLVLRGRVLNRPSDREGERAVGNALALVRCR